MESKTLVSGIVVISTFSFLVVRFLEEAVQATGNKIFLTIIFSMACICVSALLGLLFSIIFNREKL